MHRVLANGTNVREVKRTRLDDSLPPLEHPVDREDATLYCSRPESGCALL